MPYPSLKYPHVFGVRLSDADRDKLQSLADDLGLLPCQALWLLVRHATAVHTHVIFTPKRRQDPAYVPSD
jgi:hypothetical protein